MTLLNQATDAETTTGNLLTNSDFEDNIVGWTLSDKGVKIDGPYSDAGNSKIIRFKGQGSTISQLVNLTAVQEGKEIKSYTISYDGYGCGNNADGHCTKQNHDKIITNISFTDGTNTEVSSHTVSVDYADGFTHHTFTKSINDTFLTGMVAINFELEGQDSYTGNNWLAPITDNYEFSITYQDYIAQQVVAETMIGGLDLDTSVTLDLISDIQIMPEMEMIEIKPMEMPEIQQVEMIDMPDMIDMPMDIQEIRIEMPVDMPDIIEVEPIQEIQEIKTEQPEMVETQDDRQETEVEVKVADATEGKSSDIREQEPDTKEEKGKTKEVTTTKDKADTKTKLVSKPGKVETKTKAVLPVATAKPKDVEQPALPVAYLQMLTDSISIVETISLRQEQIYGGEQEYNLNTSSITIAGLDNNTSSRWSNLQNERKRFKAPKYVRRNK